jgi:hypothetical protein
VLEEGLAHAPRPTDREACLGRLQPALAERGVALTGIPTAGAAWSPEPLRPVCGEVPPPLGPCHVLQDLPQGGVKAVATERARWATAQPQWKRGKASAQDQAARRWARTSRSMPQTISALLQARFLFVTRRRTRAERTRLLHLPRGLPQLRTRRALMAPMDAWVDRRWRTQTALGQLKKRRHWVNRCTWMGDTLPKVFAPTLAKA